MLTIPIPIPHSVVAETAVAIASGEPIETAGCDCGGACTGVHAHREARPDGAIFIGAAAGGGIPAWCHILFRDDGSIVVSGATSGCRGRGTWHAVFRPEQGWRCWLRGETNLAVVESFAASATAVGARLSGGLRRAARRAARAAK
jgi:hypothetical protein